MYTTDLKKKYLYIATHYIYMHANSCQLKTRA